MHDSERPLIFAKLPQGRSLDEAFGPGTTEQPSRYTGPLVYAPVENYEREAIEKTGKQIGSHTKRNVRNDSQPVPKAPVTGFNLWIRPSGMRPVGPGDAGRARPFHIAGTYPSEEAAQRATHGVAAAYGGQPVEIKILRCDFYVTSSGEIRPISDNDFGDAREHARGVDEVSKRLAPWPGGPVNQR